jgi:hypothetical protein
MRLVSSSRGGVGVHVGLWVHIRQRIPAGSRVIDEIFVLDIKFNSANFFFALSSFFDRPPSYLFRLKETGILLSYSKEAEEPIREHNVDIIHAHFVYPEGFGVL